MVLRYSFSNDGLNRHHLTSREHHHALLDPQNAQAIQAYSTPHPRDRSQRNVAMERLRPEAHGVVRKINVVGISYCGFVAYSMAAQFPEKMEKMALCFAESSRGRLRKCRVCIYLQGRSQKIYRRGVKIIDYNIDMAMEIGTGIATKVAERCIDKAMKEAGYLCCFKSYVEDYEKEQSDCQQQEADDLINVDAKAKKIRFGFLTDCIWQYKRGKELARKTLDIPKLMERRNNLRIARSIGAPGMEYHSSPDFIYFESRKAKFEQLKEGIEE
ncbi:putative disease resistance protein [Senna tora]|uniref:Putative disease resistance protein n=1 Tax=Senna tora TaxID=362788 RepID=A0A834XDY7_9FABA|nr:putative disease resistance protein [Senna tora]